MKKILAAAVAVFAILPMAAMARGRVGIYAGPSFGPYGWYGMYDPYYGGYPGGSRFAAPNAGQVKLDTKDKEAQVYINGDYAGKAGHLKTMTLHSGNYNIAVRDSGQELLRQQIYVVPGKTLTLHPEVPTPHAGS